MSLFQNSECLNGYLHKYEIKHVFPNGVVEICERCKNKKFFKGDEPNRHYLSFHLRSALPLVHPRFNHEYK